VAGTLGKSLIVNLPGSRKAVAENLESIKFDKIVNANFSIKRFVFLFHINDFQDAISCLKTGYPYENSVIFRVPPEFVRVVGTDRFLLHRWGI
jgi:hypothetical protein